LSVLKILTLYICLAAGLLTARSTAAQLGTNAPDLYEPELMFDLSDEEMQYPLGIIADVKVGNDSIVYLLDQQNCNIRRITLRGELLPVLGRQGEGPGEMDRPCCLALFPNGNCLVVQDMSSRAVCLTPDGEPCNMGDISIFRKGFTHTIIRRIEADKEGRLILAAITMKYRPAEPGASLKDRGGSASVRRALITDGRIESLFSTDPDLSDTGTVPFKLIHSGYTTYGWDINPDGTIIYFDPKGSYSVNIGHPLDGETQTIHLPTWKYDEERIRELADDSGSDVKAAEIPRIINIEWLDDDCFIVLPTAEISLDPIPGVICTVEIFRRDGSSYGRYTIQGNYNPDNDDMYICGDILILIKGGKSIARATFSEFLPLEKREEESSLEEIDEIRVVAFRLFKALRASD